MPGAPGPSYWLIDDMIPCGSLVDPGSTLHFMHFPPPPRPSASPPGSDFHHGDGAAPCEVQGHGISRYSASQHARPFINLDTTIMCVQRLKGPFRIFLPLKNIPFSTAMCPALWHHSCDTEPGGGRQALLMEPVSDL